MKEYKPTWNWDKVEKLIDDLEERTTQWINDSGYRGLTCKTVTAKESMFLNVLIQHINIREPIKPKVPAKVLDAIEKDIPINVREILLRHLDME